LPGAAVTSLHLIGMLKQHRRFDQIRNGSRELIRDVGKARDVKDVASGRQDNRRYLEWSDVSEQIPPKGISPRSAEKEKSRAPLSRSRESIMER
jgi:hypothetical protein